MGITIKPSDLYFRYHRKKEGKEQARFCGKPDPLPFDREDLFEVIPMFEAVMDALHANDERVLRQLENIVDSIPPGYQPPREEIFDFLVEQLRAMLEQDD